MRTSSQDTWDKTHKTVITLNIVDTTEKDILDWMKGQEKPARAIKTLIRKDIKRIKQEEEQAKKEAKNGKDVRQKGTR